MAGKATRRLVFLSHLIRGSSSTSRALSFGFALLPQPADMPSPAPGAKQKSHQVATGARGRVQDESPCQENPEGGSGALPCTGFCPYGGSNSCAWPRITPATSEATGWEPAVPGVWHRAFEFQPHPTNDDLLREQGFPALRPHFPRGMLGLLGGHKVLELAGWWEQTGNLHHPETQRTALGSSQGDAGDKGPL